MTVAESVITKDIVLLMLVRVVGVMMLIMMVI